MTFEEWVKNQRGEETLDIIGEFQKEAWDAATAEAWKNPPDGWYRIGEEVEGVFLEKKQSAQIVALGECGFWTNMANDVRRKPAWTPKEGEAVLFNGDGTAWVGVVEVGNILSRGTFVGLSYAIENELVKPYKPGCNSRSWEEI